jgi:hypothetical protein
VELVGYVDQISRYPDPAAAEIGRLRHALEFGDINLPVPVITLLCPHRTAVLPVATGRPILVGPVLVLIVVLLMLAAEGAELAVLFGSGRIADAPSQAKRRDEQRK